MQWGKGGLFSKWGWVSWISMLWGEKYILIYPSPDTKIDSRLTVHLNVKDKTMYLFPWLV